MQGARQASCKWSDTRTVASSRTNLTWQTLVSLQNDLATLIFSISQHRIGKKLVTSSCLSSLGSQTPVMTLPSLLDGFHMHDVPWDIVKHACCMLVIKKSYALWLSHKQITHKHMHVQVMRPMWLFMFSLRLLFFCLSYSVRCISSNKFVCSVTSHSKSQFRAGRVLANTRDAWQMNGYTWQTNSFLTNKCQTSEGVDHSRNRQSEALSFCFSRKLQPTSVV